MESAVQVCYWIADHPYARIQGEWQYNQPLVVVQVTNIIESLQQSQEPMSKSLGVQEAE